MPTLDEMFEVAPMKWRAKLICCGRDDGTIDFPTWQKADDFREAYTSGPGARPCGRPDLSGHERAVIIEEIARAIDALGAEKGE